MATALFSFVRPSSSRKLSYRDQHNELHAALSENPTFNDGHILDTLERGGNKLIMQFQEVTFTGHILLVAHPVLHIKESDQDQLKFVRSSSLGPNFTIQQGMYEEIQYIQPDDVYVNETERHSNVGYILMGFKFPSNHSLTSTLEHTWRDWSGARFIYLNLDDCFNMRRISLYRRLQPNCVELFKYVLLVKCANVNNQNIPALLGFVQRLRVKLINAFIASYEEAK